MKISYVVLDPGIPVFGTKGASVHVQEVVRALRDEGHDVRLHAIRLGDDVPSDLADLPVHRTRLPRGLDAGEREQAVLDASAAVAEEILAEGADLVIERYSLFADVAARVARDGGIRTILEVNAPLIEEQREHRVLVDEAGAASATRRQLRSADVVACVSEQVADRIRHHGLREESCLILPNGVSTRRIRPSAPVDPTASGRVRVGFVGTLKAWHGTEVLIRAAALLPQIEVRIIGAGPERDRLGALASELGIADRVSFAGAVAPEQIPAQLARLDIAVAPYPRGDHYFSPLKIYEYLAAGLPVVASAIGTIPDVLEHGRLGVLVAPGDPEQLADALAALAADPERRAALARAGREAAVEQHDWRVRMRDLLAALDAASRARAGATDRTEREAVR